MGYADCKCFAGLVEISKEVSIVSFGLCQTHCKQVPDFSRLCRSDLITWASFSTARCNCSLYANTRSIPPVPTFGSIWVVLWLLFFRSAPSTFPQETLKLSVTTTYPYIDPDYNSPLIYWWGYCNLSIVFQARSLYIPTRNRSPSRGHFWESLVF